MQAVFEHCRCQGHDRDGRRLAVRVLTLTKGVAGETVGDIRLDEVDVVIEVALAVLAGVEQGLDEVVHSGGHLGVAEHHLHSHRGVFGVARLCAGDQFEYMVVAGAAQSVFGAEVVDDQAWGDIGGSGDSADCGLREPVAGELGDGGREDPLRRLRRGVGRAARVGVGSR